MARIRVDPSELQGFSRKLWSHSQILESVQRAVDRALHVSGWHGSSRHSIEGKWKAERRRLGQLANQAESMARYLDQKAATFARADQEGVSSLRRVAGRGAMLTSATVALPATMAVSKKVDDWLSLRDAVHGGKGLYDVYETVGTVRAIKSGKLAIRSGKTYPYQVKVFGQVRHHGPAGMAGGLRHISNLNMPAHIAKHSALTAGAVTLVAGGVVNSVENWHEYRDEGMTKVVTATVLDTALDTALVAGGTYVGAAAFGALAGAVTAGNPLAVALGAKVGGMLGGAFGGWASTQIKKSDAWDGFVDWSAEAVEGVGKLPDALATAAVHTVQGEVERISSAFNTVTKVLSYNPFI